MPPQLLEEAHAVAQGIIVESIDKAYDLWTEYGEAVLDGTQLVLDAAGLVPAVGELFDLANAGVSIARGNYDEAMLSMAAMVPIVGIGATAGKVGAKGVETLKIVEDQHGFRKTKINLFKWGKPSTEAAKGWESGDAMLYLPDKLTAKANWKQNAGRLREQMKKGDPIYDSFVDSNGIQIKSEKKGFLDMERYLLEEKGWKYDSKTQAYYKGQ